MYDSASERIAEEPELAVPGGFFASLFPPRTLLTLPFPLFSFPADETEREPQPRIIEEATIVVTANEDVEIPAEAAPLSTDQGDFDASAAGGLYDDDEDEEEDQTAQIEDVPTIEEVVDQEDVETIAEVEKEAADATTSSEAVETVPVPPQFVVEEGDAAASTTKDVDVASEVPPVLVSSESSLLPSLASLVFSSSTTDVVPPRSPLPAPAPFVSVPAVANAAASSSRRSTRLNPSSNAPSPAPTPAHPDSSLEVPEELYGDGPDEVDLYADSPLPSKPVEDHLEEVEPLGLHEEVQEDSVQVEEVEEEEGDSDHTLAESVENLAEVVAEVDGDVEEGSQTGGASPKRRFDELEKDDANGEVVETVEVRGPFLLLLFPASTNRD